MNERKQKPSNLNEKFELLYGKRNANFKVIWNEMVLVVVLTRHSNLMRFVLFFHALAISFGVGRFCVLILIDIFS